MNEKYLKFYNTIKDWDFSKIRYSTEDLTDWNFYEKIKENTDENSLCLDIGTGGGEKVIRYYPNVAMVIATDASTEMLKTAKENLKKYTNKKIKFAWMNNLNMNFPKGIFDLISARHTIIDARQIYYCLADDGTVVIQGVDKQDCWQLKEMFGRGQAYNDEINISEKDYIELKNAGFTKIEKVQILQNEYYKTKEDLMALLLKTPILDDFSEINEGDFEHITLIDNDIFNKYVEKNTTKKGILLKRVLYGIVAKK